MFQPLAAFIGWRYTRSRRRDHFISFIALISLLGMVLGVAALIVVMSVMNGFESELRGRILALVPHGFIESPDGKLRDWQTLAADVPHTAGLIAAAPFVGGSAMLTNRGPVRGVQLWAIDTAYEKQVSDIGRHVVDGHYDNLPTTPFGIVIGDILARHLGAMVGDSIDVILPKVTVTPMGVFPRQKRFTVVAIFRSGSQLDGSTAFINLNDGQRLYQMGDAVTGLRVAAKDLFAAGPLLQRWNTAHGDKFVVRDWSQTQGSLFQSVRMEKTMVGLLLFIIVGIAAFNIVSILTMMVSDKRSDIAVLRTMGASPRSIMIVFMVQGAVIGLSGIAIGALIGVPIALNAGAIVEVLEKLFGAQVFDPQVYFISRIPSVVVPGDIVKICIAAWCLSLLAAIYPARRAAQIQPAEALRYE
ncbi:MAG: lipoprotein releasing system, transrane protein LolC/E family [Verrucomicrobiaceae bacterium]|nr:lipoprotein releasing system, transrane protein LolC/E family [Verrucomicrobiaceae bacterium]